ncbi:tetratricopeptide repeat protein [Dactylosporangium sp. AC04546]|uniref:tetratricopeptide repeat protein n=1 Tax=Dactylosporangium sp. AC04546 TaxID=2862460 RepID=UPI001EE02AFD|nr:tetratricopeptide repeat protein [Dactylosporangium sp. AC04546]WVK87362.1 tetratricopeptide repeat protein [Dactylosporangium sp. AC04546]
MAERLWVNRNDGIISIGDHAVNTITNVVLPQVRDAATVPAPPGLIHLRQASVTEALFVGRAEELDAVAAALEQGNGVITQAITGLGGIGKSTLAERYALSRRDRHNPIWWLTAESPAQLETGLAALAARLDPGLAARPEVGAEWCRAWLDTHDGWLLVLDNVARPADVAELIGDHPRGRFLVTSRQTSGWTGIAVTARLDVLPAEPSLELLRRLAPADLLDGAAELAAALGGLPLAIDLAGAYLAQNRVTARAYLERLAQPAGGVWSWTPDGGDPQRTVGRVWQVTFDRVEAEHGPLPGRLLQTIAWYAPDDIPLAVLAAEAPDGDAALDEAVGRLAAYGLVTRDGDAISVHRLVQAVNRAGSPAERCVRAVEALRAAWEGAPTHAVFDRLAPHLDALLEHAAQLPGDADLLAGLVEAAGRLAEVRGWSERATTHLERLAERQRRLLGPGHPDLVDTRGALAVAHVEAGDAGTAVALLEEVVADGLRAFGRRHPATVLARYRLAFASARNGGFGRSWYLLEQTLRDAERSVGRDHRYTLSLRYALIELLTDSVRRQQRYGPRPLRFARTTYSALSQYGKLIESLRRQSGPADPAALAIVSELAWFQLTIGVAGLAAQNFAVLYDAAQERHGPDADETRSARRNLARAHLESQQPERAVPLFERLVEDAGDGPELAGALHELGRAYAAARDTAAAQAAFERSAELRVSTGDRGAADYPTEVGEAFEAERLAAESIPWYERALAAAPDERARLKAGNNLAVAHAGAGHHAVALEMLAGIVPGYRREFGASHHETMTVEENIADITAAAEGRRGRRWPWPFRSRRASRRRRT